jgi:hypothetical protein
VGPGVGVGAAQGPAAKRRVRQLFWMALALRVAVALTIHVWLSEGLFAPDQYTYDSGGRMLASRWSQDLPLPPSWTERSGPKGYFYIVGLLYYFFGPYAIVPKLVNSVVGALTIPVVYDLAIRMGGSASAALRAAAYAAWFPSLVLWSALNIRDVWIILLILFICRQALILQDRFSPLSLLLLGGALLALVQFRAYVLFAVAGPVVLSFVVQRSRHAVRNLIVGSIAVVAIIGADQIAGAHRKLRVLDFEQLNQIREWNTMGAASQFEEADISTPTKALRYLPQGLGLFLLAPFPWQVGSIRQILALPETLFFYWLIPWMLRGIRYLVRHHLRSSLMALLITAGLTLGYALGEGNAGTAYRHRAQLLSFFLIYAAVGQKEQERRSLPLRSPALARPA